MPDTPWAGRLALGFRRLLKPTEVASWLHTFWCTDPKQSPRDWIRQQQVNLAPTIRLMATSPFQLNNLPTRHGTVLIIGASLEDLKVAERLLGGYSNHP